MVDTLRASGGIVCPHIMNLRLLAAWTAQHDNGWTTYAIERGDGAFCGGAAPTDVNGARLEYVEDGPEHAKIAAEFDLKQKTGHERCSDGCSGWQLHTHEVDVRDERSTENRRSNHAPPDAFE
jgi:hypothetical protein